MFFFLFINRMFNKIKFLIQFTFLHFSLIKNKVDWQLTRLNCWIFWFSYWLATEFNSWNAWRIFTKESMYIRADNNKLIISLYLDSRHGQRILIADAPTGFEQDASGLSGIPRSPRRQRTGPSSLTNERNSSVLHCTHRWIIVYT